MSRNQQRTFDAKSRNDPNFPWLEVGEYFEFPNLENSVSSVVGVGGNLSPGMLLSAYIQGVFPWFNEDDPLYWQSPDPRFVITQESFKIPKRLERDIKKSKVIIKTNTDFLAVLSHCAYINRKGQRGTWITDDMQEAYIRLHEEGFAHSVETYLDEKLVGGLYGVLIGPVFFGESMFAKTPNASKYAFVYFAKKFFSELGGKLIDSQVYTDHMARFGGKNISRTAYIRMLSDFFSESGFEYKGGSRELPYNKGLNL